MGAGHQGVRFHRQRRRADLHDGEKAVRLARKYAPLVPALEDLVARPDTPLMEDVKDHILGHLREAASRCNAIIVVNGNSTVPGGR